MRALPSSASTSVQLVWAWRENGEERLTGARVGVAGDNCIDAYEADGVLRCAIGGNALNVAINLSRHKVACEYFGTIGSDDRGRAVRTAAVGAGVAARLRVVDGPTWITFVRTDDMGTTRIVWQDPGASGSYVPTPAELEALSDCDFVHMANMADPEVVAGALRRSDVLVSYDHGTEESLAAPVGIAFFSYSGEDAAERGAEIARKACKDGATLSVVTLGGDGSLVFDGARLTTQSAEDMRPVDTLGAGDSYIGAFIASRLAGESIESAMLAGTRAASRTCLHWAAWPQDALRAISDDAFREGGDCR